MLMFYVNLWNPMHVSAAAQHVSPMHSAYGPESTGVRENGVFFRLQVGGNRRFLRHTR